LMREIETELTNLKANTYEKVANTTAYY
jgi:hypothetical protein